MSVGKVWKMKFLAVLAIVITISFNLVAADYNTIQIADKDFLLKQKKIYNLLYYISQPSLVNPSLYEEGRSYDIKANIDSYTNTVNTKQLILMVTSMIILQHIIRSITKCLLQNIHLDPLYRFADCGEKLLLSIREWYASSWRAQFLVLSKTP